MFDLSGDEIQILKFIATAVEKTAASAISYFSLQPTLDAGGILIKLVKVEYLIQSGYSFFVTEKGELFLRDYDKYGSEELFNGDLDFVILEFLYAIKSRIHIKLFPASIKNHAIDVDPQYKTAEPHYRLQHYVWDHANLSVYINCRSAIFSLNPAGKSYFESLLIKRKEENEEKQTEKRLKKVDLVTKEFIYKKRYWPFGISAAAACISLGSFIVAAISLSNNVSQSKRIKELEMLQRQNAPKIEMPVKPILQKDTIKK